MNAEKQPQHTPETRLQAPRSADWGPTTETPAGRPQLGPRVGVHQEQRLAAPHTSPRPQTSQQCTSLRPKAAKHPATHDSVPNGGTSAPGDSGPSPQAARTTQAQSSRSADQWPGCLPGTTPKSTSSEQLLPSPCSRSPAGPTGSLGLRQNTQQRGAAGLGETAFPGKTRPSRRAELPHSSTQSP